jgi:hypothetical protein
MARSNELCYNPFTNTVLVANDEAIDNFITFISAENYEILGTIKFDGTDKNGNYINANGIEQCAYNPQDKKFYLNIPMTGGAGGTGAGLNLTISEHAPFHVERVFTIDPVATGCFGPQGLAFGPSNTMGLGCGTGGKNSLIINSTNGKPAAIVTGEGGTDEAWYNPTANQFYFARSGAGVLGVADAGPPATVVTPDFAAISMKPSATALSYLTPQVSTKASNAASASFLVSAIQISWSARLAFECWLFGSLFKTLAVLWTQQR